MEQITKTFKVVESQIDIPLQNPYVMAITKIFLALFGAMIAPRPPKFLQDILSNTFVKVAFIALIVYISEKDLQLALLCAIIFVFGINVLSGRSFLESFTSYSGTPELAEFLKDYKITNKMTLLESKSDLFPGCENVTMNDLVKLFDGDVSKFSKAVNVSFRELIATAKNKTAKDRIMTIAHYAGLNDNMTFDNPETAPYLATLLVNYGFNISDKCQPPH